MPSPLAQALYLTRQPYRRTVPSGVDNNRIISASSKWQPYNVSIPTGPKAYLSVLNILKISLKNTGSGYSQVNLYFPINLKAEICIQKNTQVHFPRSKSLFHKNDKISNSSQETIGVQLDIFYLLQYNICMVLIFSIKLDVKFCCTSDSHGRNCVYKCVSQTSHRCTSNACRPGKFTHLYAYTCT